jgi:hypothetical protein
MKGGGQKPEAGSKQKNFDSLSCMLLARSSSEFWLLASEFLVFIRA